MPSSELTDALNPQFVQSRTRPSISFLDTSQISTTAHEQSSNRPPSSSLDTVLPSKFHTTAAVDPQQLRHFVPHRSELEHAISESALIPPVIPSAPPPAPPRFDGGHVVRELLRVLAASKDAIENERKRRVAWEQKHEAKTSRLEEELVKMRQELDELKQNRASRAGSSELYTHNEDQLDSLSPDIDWTVDEANFSGNIGPDGLPVNHGRTEASGSRGHFSSAAALQQLERLDLAGDLSSGHRRKRARLTLQTDAEFNRETSSGRSSSDDDQPVKRINHHDTRCLNIQHAMRLHFLHLMDIESDKNLPDSHIEGAPLGSADPVRFIWEKTPKRSPHNAAMKERVLTDLVLNRTMYPHVPKKDFSDTKKLGQIFDQAFTTLRQKFKAQRDDGVALRLRTREEAKSIKARRLARKKLKCNNREETRKKIEGFSHATFDGAMQLDCMSSEESDGEIDDDQSGSGTRVFLTRGLLWRSSRLQKFYDTLDDDDKVDKTIKPKRGIGKRERRIGAPKEASPLPPKGVTSWMISKRWKNVLRETNPELLAVLDELVVDPPGFDWSRFVALGDETEDERDVYTSHDPNQSRLLTIM